MTTIEITKSDVPEWLHQSEFYKTIGSEEGNFNIPKNIHQMWLSF